MSETSNAPAGRAGIAAHYVEGAGASTHSHSEWIVGRSRALMNNPGSAISPEEFPGRPVLSRFPFCVATP